MNEELAAMVKDAMRLPTWWDRIKNQIRLMMLKKSEVQFMCDTLIKDAKPLFQEHIMNQKEVTPLDRFALKCFDEGITRLPRDSVAELKEDLEKLKNAKSKEAKDFLKANLVNKLTVYYSLGRWFREKVISAIADRKF